MSNKPAKTFRHGAIGVSVWERQGKKGVFYDFTVMAFPPSLYQTLRYTDDGALPSRRA